MSTLALTELLGAPVYDSTGAHAGRVREVALCPQEDPQHVTALIVKTKHGDRLLKASSLLAANGGVRASTSRDTWTQYAGSEGMLLLGRDLLDQQIIDVHGRKVVRVNDVELLEETSNRHVVLKVGAVDVGSRG